MIIKAKFLNHYYSLDIVKIFASVCIVFHHYQQMSGVNYSVFNFYGGVFPFERMVELFFLISGALVFISDCKSNEKYNITKIKKRILHFYPITTIAFFLIFITGQVQYYLFHSFPTSADYHSLKCIITSITLTHRGWPLLSVERGINNPTWYLCVLIVCYIIYYVLLMLEKRALK